MRVIQLYRHGFTMGTPPASSSHLRAPRSTVAGWSHGATRRNIAFLRSIDETKVIYGSDGNKLIALAVTLTLRDCPPTSDDFHRVRNALIRRLKRLGMVRMHWVIEWQRRGVPHLHCAVWFEHQDYVALHTSIINAWLELTQEWRTGRSGQFITPINDAVGWFEYVSKHAARGVNHYQRSPDNIPKSWLNKTGRVWGKVGDWSDVLVPAGRIDVEKADYFKMRRIVRAWRLADSRSNVRSYGVKRIAAARRMLKCHDRARSETRGASEWMPEEQFMVAYSWLISQTDTDHTIQPAFDSLSVSSSEKVNAIECQEANPKPKQA